MHATQPNQISFAGNSTQFFYNANHQRWKQVANYGGVTESTWYIGGLIEKVTRSGVTEYRHLIPAGSGNAIYTRRDTGTASTYYVTTDHLGSGDLVLDSAANILAKESFTPFGARRGSNWQGNPSSADYTTFQSTTRRGFTGHEMLDSVSLVHMNGRVYDPYVGRFLSPDPIIQTLGLSQALNAYSYVMNNPLSLIDPSGYSWLSKAFKSVGKFFKNVLRKWGGTIISIGFAMAGMPFIGGLVSSAFGTFINGGNFGGFASGFLIGMAAGVIAGPIAGGASRMLGMAGGSIATQVFRGALAGGMAGGLASSVSGGSFWAGFSGGALTGGITAGAIGLYRANLLNKLMRQGRVSCNPCSSEAMAGLREFAQSPQGQGFLKGLRASGDSLGIFQDASENHGARFYRSFEQGEPHGLGLPLDLAAYRSRPEAIGERSGSATFGNLIAHEVGHYYPSGQYPPGGMAVVDDQGFETVTLYFRGSGAEVFASIVENGHRLWMGQPLRSAYENQSIPLRLCTYCTR